MTSFLPYPVLRTSRFLFSQGKPVQLPGLVFSALLILLSGCGGLIEAPPAAQVYTLRPLQEPLPSLRDQQPLAINLSVARPIVSPGLERDWIALLRPNHQLSYYDKARWAAPTAQLVRFFLIDSLRNQNLFHSVGADTRSRGANYRLDTHIQAFHAIYEEGQATPRIELQLAFELTDNSGTSMESFVERVNLPLPENRLTVVVAGFQQALTQATTRASERLARRLAQLPSP